jgi:GH25 family lysozyme M1 (1,4-beta-N-acetylmuramidase)
VALNVYVDISSNNGTPNLPAYKAAGHTDLMLKATQGDDYHWPEMSTLAQQWHSFGPNYRVGYYHWLYGTISAQLQFNFFWSHVAPVWRAGDWLMTDFEDVDPSRWVSDSQHMTVLRGFNDLCRSRGPIHAYTGNWYLNNLPQCAAYLRTQPVVMSDYSNTPPANPYGLSYVAHQFTDRATVAGMPGPVDYNRWLGETTAGGGTPITNSPLEDSLSAADVADLKAYIDKAISSVLYGDGRDVPASKNTHPDNIARLRDDLANVAGALQLMIRGDGKDVLKGSDTHPWNLKNTFNDLQTVLAQLGELLTRPASGGTEPTTVTFSGTGTIE